jgi:L-lactate dehydrogenase complex protein LldG
MRTPHSSREQVLRRIRKETASVALTPGDLPSGYAGISRSYIRKGELSTPAKIALLIERLRDYDADVAESTLDGLSGSIQALLSSSGRHTFGAPSGLRSAWMVAGFDWKIDNGMSNDNIETLDGVVTTAFCAIAESGTIVLHHSRTAGRRSLTLLPDWHLCILLASQVVETLPEYFARVQQPPELVTWISGPSATADIEMTRIKGVHGPRHLNVILVRDDVESHA